MTWDPIPSEIGGTADAARARNVNHAAAGGVEGVAGPLDCEVRALAFPGAAVRLTPGTVAIAHRSPGAVDEMYVARNTAEHTVAIAAAGPAGRSDLIVARVEDPAGYGDWPTPADPTAGPYTYTRVLSGVPAGTTSAVQVDAHRSEYALARIDLPPNATSVTQAMVTDLRTLTRTARASERTAHVHVPEESHNAQADGFNTPFPGIVLAAPVPAWATRARAVVTVSGVRFGGAGDNGGAGWDTAGDLAVRWGWSSGSAAGATTPFALRSEGGVARATLIVADPARAVPTSARGATLELALEVVRAVGGTPAAQLYVDSATAITADVEFYNDVESNG